MFNNNFSLLVLMQLAACGGSVPSLVQQNYGGV